jgi:hypothetical protein
LPVVGGVADNLNPIAVCSSNGWVAQVVCERRAVDGDRLLCARDECELAPGNVGIDGQGNRAVEGRIKGHCATN